MNFSQLIDVRFQISRVVIIIHSFIRESSSVTTLQVEDFGKTM